MIIDSHCHAWEYWPYQDRNDHDLSKDLEKEVIGYRNTVAFLRKLNEVQLPSRFEANSLEMYSKLVEGIKDLPFISEKMTKLQPGLGSCFSD